MIRIGPAGIPLSCKGRTNRDGLMYTREILQDIVNKIKEIAEREGYIYVFDRAALVYGAPTQDITEEVIAELNKDYKAKKK